MSDKAKLSTQEWLLLSAYLDDHLSEKEKRKAEQLLTTRPACAAALEDLKRLQILLRQVPIRRVPRNFPISPEAAARPRLPTTYRLMRFASVVAAALLTFTLALDYLPAFKPLAARAPQAEMLTAEEAAAPAAMALKSAEEPPDIIFWGGMPAMGAYGKGVGGAEGMGGAPSIDYGIGGGLPAPEMPVPEAIVIPPDELSELEGAPAEVEMVPEMAPDAPPEARDTAPMEGAPLTGSAPILGVRPPGERGQVEALFGQPVAMPTRTPGLPLRTIQILLIALMVLTAIPAWLIRRR